MRLKEVVRLLCGSVAVYLMAVACSGGRGAGHNGSGPGPVGIASADDGNDSGSRLKAQRYIGVDGSTQFFGWYDTVLGVPCAFGNASDGTIRCLPTNSVVLTIEGGILFGQRLHAARRLQPHFGLRADRFADADRRGDHDHPGRLLDVDDQLVQRRSGRLRNALPRIPVELLGFARGVCGGDDLLHPRSSRLSGAVRRGDTQNRHVIRT